MCNGRDALLRVRWPHAVFGRAGAHDGEAPSPRRFRSSGSSTLPLPISVAMAPSPSHRGKAPYGTRRRGAVATIPHDGGAHPSCDRLRGSLRSGDMSPRFRTTAGRTPLATACAAHFVRGICRHDTSVRGQIYQLPTTIYQLPTKCNRKSKNRKFEWRLLPAAIQNLKPIP